jgi:hypothetical protein
MGRAHAASYRRAMVQVLQAAEAAPTPRGEARTPVILTIMAVVVIMAVLPERVRILPRWITILAAGVQIAALAAAALFRGRRAVLLVERWITVAFLSFAGAVMLSDIDRLIGLILQKAGTVDGLKLLTTSIAVWVINVLIFSLAYWQLDRGGPAGREADLAIRPDWRFPQDDMDDLFPEGWRPRFVDYLFLAFSTATAFSTTDVTPMSHRSKLMMMTESLISLVNIAVVGARAINVLGG